MSVIKVLQIGISDRVGGIETFLKNYNNSLDRNQCIFDFVITNYSDEMKRYYCELEKEGSSLYYVSDFKKKPFKSFKEIKRIINEKNYDIIHYNMNSAVYLLPLFIGKVSKAKTVIAHSHNSSSDKGILKSIIHGINKNFLPFLATDYFACSEKAGKWFFSKKVVKDDLYIVKNAIDVKKFQYNKIIRNKIRKELGISESIHLFGHVGRFNKQKNHKFLIDVFSSVNKKFSNTRLLLIGDGPLRENVQKYVKEKKLDNSVIFLGQISNVNEFFQAIDSFVLPSLYEGLPLVGIEAQASGLNCYFSDSITKELNITDLANYISIDNLDMWVSKICQDLSCKKINDDREKYASDIIKEGYDINNATKKLTNIYKKITK